MENCSTKINVVTFIFMGFLAGEITNSKRTHRNDSYQLLSICFKGNDLFT